MAHTAPKVALRRRLLLWCSVLAVVMGLLTMHQLSVNHTAAQAINRAHGTSAETAHEHAGMSQAAIVEKSASANIDGACADCGDQHHSMALTCLMILSLVAISLLARFVRTHVTIRVSRAQTYRSLPLRSTQYRPRARSLIELSVSRT